MNMEKSRLDNLMTEHGLAESRSQAQRLIMAGQVRVDNEVVLKPSHSVNVKAVVTVEQPPRFVSRGGEKLEAALVAFGLQEIPGWICADVGASTGGFTDCLLQHGAAKIYAIDVGYGILHWKLRQDTRVLSMERTNARNVQVLAEPVHLITIDASFISLRNLLPVVKNWLDGPEGRVVALVKPQFEAGRKESAKGEGVIRDPEIHKRILNEVIEFSIREGFKPSGLIRSPLQGPKGNIEFLLLLEPKPCSDVCAAEMIEKVLRGDNGGMEETTLGSTEPEN